MRADEENESGERSFSEIASGVAVRVIAVILLLIVSYAAVFSSFRFGYRLFCADSAEAAPGTDVEIEITEGETVDEIAASLYADKIIPDELAFRVQAALRDISFYPGTYSLNTSMSTKEILKAIDMTEQEYRDKLALEAVEETIEDGVIAGGDEGADPDYYGNAELSYEED